MREKSWPFNKLSSHISATGSYMRNQKNIALLGEDKFLAIGSLTSNGTFGLYPLWGQVQGNLNFLQAMGAY